MTDFVANFDLQQNNLQADFGLENTEFDALFQINPTGAAWGGITGQITAQTDLVEYIDEAAQTYTHEQGVASNEWNIEHNLGKYPSVTVVDTAGTVFLAEVKYINENNCIVYINGATKGKAYLN